MTRLAPLDPEAFTDKQDKVYQSIINGPRGKFGGPFPALIHASEISDKIQSLGESIRFNTTLPSSLREIAVLCVARYWRNEVEWNAHVVIALKEDVSIETIKSILLEHALQDTFTQTQLVISICAQLQHSHTIENDTYRMAIEFLGVEQVVELISIIGYFTLLSMVLNSFEIDSDPKDKLPPKDLLMTACDNH